MDRLIKTEKGIPKINVDYKGDMPLMKKGLQEKYNKPPEMAKTSRQQAKP